MSATLLTDVYSQVTAELTAPDTIEGEGYLVGWSMGLSPKRRTIGFSFSDSASQEEPHLLDPILFNAEGHLMTIAATGAGKGVGCIIPALLKHTGPMIVIDPKGENAAVTRRYREHVLGQTVHVIDPMGTLPGPSARLNPLDLVDPSSDNSVDEAASLADLLSEHMKSDQRNQYWVNRGRHLLIAMILNAVSSPEKGERSLAAIRKHLNRAATDDGQYLRKLLENSAHEEARQASGAVEGLAPETFASITSMASDMVDFVRGEPLRRATSQSDISLEDVMRGTPMTIYIVLPPYMLESHAPLLRLWVGVLFKAIMRRNFKVPQSTMLILDEAAQLGSFAPLRQAITLLRGYGLQTWSFWQDVSQLIQAYPESWRTLINNCQVVQAFGAPNMSAARSVSDLFELGQPASILDLDSDEMVVQIAGDDAFVARRPNYLQEPCFEGKYDLNPFYTNTPPPPKKTPKRRKEVYLRKDTDSDKDKEGDKEGASDKDGDEALIKELIERFS